MLNALKNLKSINANDSVKHQSRFNREKITNLLIKNSMVLVLLLVMVYFNIKNSNFATIPNLRAILIAAAPFALITLGQTLVIFTGGIDLSVGSIIALTTMTGAKLVVTYPHEIVLSIVAAVLIGLVAGLVNGFVISYLNVTPFVTTLGMLTVASGLAYAIGQGAPINGLPDSWGKIANTKFLGFETPVFIMAAGFILLGIIISKTAFGMRIFAVGGNRVAAEVAGVNPRRILIYVYAISGTLAGISGVILSSRVISGPPNLGQGYELSSIAAVVIGGASLMGGRGSIWGSFLGLFLIQTLNNGLDILIIPAYWQKVISGLLIVSAVAVDVWATKRISR
jgi:ribose transport system permease protein